MLQSLSEARIDNRYPTIINTYYNIYRNAIRTERLHEDTANFPIKQGVRQGDVISPIRVFTTLMEFMFGKVEIWAL